MDAARPLPHRRERPSYRHRAAARPLRDRALFGRLSPRRWREGNDGRHQGHPAHDGLRSVARRQRARQGVARRARRRLRALHQRRLHQAARPVRRLQSRDRRADRARDPGLSGGYRRRGRRGAEGSSRNGRRFPASSGRSISMRSRATCRSASASSRCWKRSTTASRSANRATSTFPSSPAISTIMPAGPR